MLSANRATAFAIVLCALCGDAYAEWAFTFNGQDNGVPVDGVSGKMVLDWDDGDSSQLNVYVDNTSALYVSNVLNLVDITAFGFNVLPDTLTLNDVSWKLTAFDTDLNSVVLGGSDDGYFDTTGAVSKGDWVLDTDPGGAIKLDFTAATDQGANGALRNPGLLGEAGYQPGKGEIRFYTQALLTVKFWKDAELDLERAPQMRWQEAGVDQELSAKGVGVVVPVPPSLAMLASGVFSILGLCWGRRRPPATQS